MSFSAGPGGVACPGCGSPLTLAPDHMPKFCENCGSALDLNALVAGAGAGSLGSGLGGAAPSGAGALLPAGPAGSAVPDPGQVQSLLDQATGSAENGQMDDAMSMLQQAKTLDPKNPQVWTLEGGLLSAQGRHEDALRSLENALSLDNTSALAWALKGNALGSLGRGAEGMSCVDQALNLDPTNEMAQSLKQSLGGALGGASAGSLGSNL